MLGTITISLNANRIKKNMVRFYDVFLIFEVAARHCLACNRMDKRERDDGLTAIYRTFTQWEHGKKKTNNNEEERNPVLYGLFIQ
jgi:hypothetical protein